MRSTTGTRLSALAAATALLVTACSGGNEPKAGDSSSAPSGEKVELTFWTWAPGMEDIVGVWNEANPDIQVTVQTQDGGDPAVTKLLTAIQAGSGAPDIMQTEYQKIPTLVASDALADLAGQLPDDVVSHYPEGVWNSVTLGTDAVYGIPQDSGPMQFYYRADIFAEMGLAVPTTWEEYAAVAAQVRAADPTKFLGTFSANDAGWFTGLAQQAGASWWGIDGDAWTVSIDDEATLRVAEYWGGLVADGVIGRDRQQADVHPGVERRAQRRLADRLALGRVGARRPRRQRGRHRGAVGDGADAAVGHQQPLDRKLGRLGHLGDLPVRARRGGDPVHPLDEQLPGGR